MSVDFNQGFEAGLRSCQHQMEGKIAELQAKLDTANSDIDRLNQMLRKTGYGQGQIDAYADECEARERAEEQLAAAKAENADLVEKYNFELEELRMEIKRLKSGVRDVASLCTNCNNLDDAQAELWKLLKDETPRSGCAPCEWDANEDRYEECRKLLRAAVSGTRIVPSGDGRAMHYLAVTEDWYDEAEKLTEQ